MLSRVGTLSPQYFSAQLEFEQLGKFAYLVKVGSITASLVSILSLISSTIAEHWEFGSENMHTRLVSRESGFSSLRSVEMGLRAEIGV